jgi:hypothetical protein
MANSQWQMAKAMLYAHGREFAQAAKNRMDSITDSAALRAVQVGLDGNHCSVSPFVLAKDEVYSA